MENNDSERATFLKWARALALITICYNLAEGIFSVLFGAEDGTISLFGFGIDSFVEVISGIGIWHMVMRMERHGDESRDRFEKTALRVTGTGFYILTFGLLVTAAFNIYTGQKPATTFWSIVIGTISIIAMSVLIHYKNRVGRAFGSSALLADAACTKTCLYLSIILLAAGVGFEITGIGLIDSLGAIGIAIFSFREGREAFEKARGGSCCCEPGCNSDSKLR